MQRLVERLFVTASWFSAVATLAVVGIFIGFLLHRGLGTLGPGLFFGNVAIIDALTGRVPVWHGIWPAVAGTVLLVLLSTVMAVPLGLASGIYLAEYAEGRWKDFLGFACGLAGRDSFHHHGALWLRTHTASEENDPARGKCLLASRSHLPGFTRITIYGANHPGGPGGPAGVHAAGRPEPRIYQPAEHSARACPGISQSVALGRHSVHRPSR
jgi:hypothetical protein